jgi:Spy/CpxP family protein refolding chaperone
VSIATADGAAKRGWLGRRWVLALLAVSLALNVCVVAGALWSRFHPPPPPPIGAERFRVLSEELKLTPEQRTAFAKYVTFLRTGSEHLRAQVDPLFAATWSEAGKDKPDQAKANQLLDEVSGLRLAYQREVLAQTTALLAAFTPEQRAKFVADVLERRGAGQRRHYDPSTR